MQLQVFFSPADLLATHSAHETMVCIVIDVIRATTSITAIFEHDGKRVFAASSIEQAQDAAHRRPERLLCGERNALALPGFDYGNSPVQFSQAPLEGREIILATTNGSKAFFACSPTSIRLAGCFYNAHTVCAYAITEARRTNHDIAIVCAAEAGYFALDDAVCAGHLAHEIRQMFPTIVVHESVPAAIALAQAFPIDTLRTASHSARQVIDNGLANDIDVCLHVDGSTVVGQVIGQEEETGLLILEPVAFAD
jgi:2-phosphosulfolactate phosphatase